MPKPISREKMLGFIFGKSSSSPGSDNPTEADVIRTYMFYFDEKLEAQNFNKFSPKVHYDIMAYQSFSTSCELEF